MFCIDSIYVASAIASPTEAEIKRHSEKHIKTISIAIPSHGKYDIQGLFRKEQDEVNFRIFKIAGSSFFSRYDLNKANHYFDFNIINFNQIEIEKSFTFSFDPMLDHPSELELANYRSRSNSNKKPPTMLTLFLIKFPFF